MSSFLNNSDFKNILTSREIEDFNETLKELNINYLQYNPFSNKLLENSNNKESSDDVKKNYILNGGNIHKPFIIFVDENCDDNNNIKSVNYLVNDLNGKEYHKIIYTKIDSRFDIGYNLDQLYDDFFY